MNKNFSPKDWQLLSNYLDGQLSNREVLILGARLNQEQPLKDALLELQQTRYLLQHARKVPVPRSFTLTPDMASQMRSSRKPLFPFFSFASVMATIFLVVVLLFEFLPGMLSSAFPQKAASNEVFSMEAAPMAAEALDSAEAPQIIEWGHPQSKLQEGIGMGGGGADTGLLSAPPVGGGIDNEPEMPAEEPGPIADENRSMMKQAEVEPITGSGPILGIRPAEETAAFNDSVLAILSESGEESIRTVSNPFPWLRVSQIILAMIAIGTAITAFILRKGHLRGSSSLRRN